MVRYCLVFVFLLLVAGTTSAQQLPSSIDSGRLGERVAPPPRVTQEYLPLEQKEVLTLPPEPADGFVLKMLSVNGNTVFTDAELTEIAAPLIGKKTNIERLHYLAKLITQHYHEAGYVLSQTILPAQDIKNGVVRLQVVEGYITQVQFDGAEVFTDRLGILEQGREDILAMRPLDGKKLERILRSMSDLGGVEAKATLQPMSRSASAGTTSLQIHFSKRKPEHRVVLDNYGTRYGGPVQLTGYSQFFPEWFGLDTLSFSALTSVPLDEAHFLSASYTLPIASDGTTLGFNASYSDSAPGYNLRSNDVKSDSYNLGVQVTHPILHDRSTRWDLTPSFDLKNSTTDILKTPISNDRNRALRITNDFSHADSWDGSMEGNFTVSQGLDILGARETGSRNLSRVEGKSDFTKIDGTISRSQILNQDWQVNLSAAGQYAWSPLLSAEEYGFGGQKFGRAYNASEITGDHGLAGSIEVQYNSLPPQYDIYLQPFVYYDIGKVWNLDADAQDTAAASAGVGVNAQHTSGVSGSFTIAQPLTRHITTPAFNNGKSTQFLFQIGMGF